MSCIVSRICKLRRTDDDLDFARSDRRGFREKRRLSNTGACRHACYLDRTLSSKTASRLMLERHHDLNDARGAWRDSDMPCQHILAHPLKLITWVALDTVKSCRRPSSRRPKAIAFEHWPEAIGQFGEGALSPGP